MIPVFVRRTVEYLRLSPFRVRSTGGDATLLFVSNVVDVIILSTEKLSQTETVGLAVLEQKEA